MLARGEIIRTSYFSEVTKIPDEKLSASSRKRRNRQQRKTAEQKRVRTSLPNLLMPDPKSWNWTGMGDYSLSIRHWTEQQSLGDGSTITHAFESTSIRCSFSLVLLQAKEEEVMGSPWKNPCENGMVKLNKTSIMETLRRNAVDKKGNADQDMGKGTLLEASLQDTPAYKAAMSRAFIGLTSTACA